MTTYEAYARRGRIGAWRYLGTTAFALAASLALGIIVLLPLELMHKVPADFAQAGIDPDHPQGFFLLNGFTFGLVLAGFAIGAWLIQRKSPRDICGDWSWSKVGFGVGAWTLVLVAASLLDFAIAPSGFRLSMGPQTLPLALWALIGLAIQTFTEEFIFRGYLTQGLFLALKRPLPTAVLSGLLFGSVHIPNGLPQAVGATLFGIGTALIALRTGGIALTFGLHLANNLFGAVVLVSSDDVFHNSPALVTQHTPQLDWWDSAVGGLAILAFAAVVWWRIKPSDAQRVSAPETA